MKKRVVVFAAICVLAAIFTTGLCLAIYALAVSFGMTSICLDGSVTYQRMEGFGASSAWTYQEFGKLQNDDIKADAMEMLYGESGLGLNIFRYNIGAGGAESDQYEDPMRGGESFFIAERFSQATKDYSVFSEVANYDFTRDAGVTELLKRALQCGNLNRIVFFANSPHYFMTKNGKTHADEPYVNNLKEECYEAFSEYLCLITGYIYENVVAPYAREIEVQISPVNEPQWRWGGADATQEGCHYDPEELGKFYAVFDKTLKKYNKLHGTAFEMDIFESENYKLMGSRRTKFMQYMAEFEKYDYFEDLKHISVHSYGADISVRHRNIFRKQMDKKYGNLRVSMTEYCTMTEGVSKDMDMGLSCGKVIMRDLTLLQATD